MRFAALKAPLANVDGIHGVSVTTYIGVAALRGDEYRTASLDCVALGDLRTCSHAIPAGRCLASGQGPPDDPLGKSTFARPCLAGVPPSADDPFRMAEPQRTVGLCRRAKEDRAPQSYQGKILVPFPIESSLSGVHKSFDGNSRLWYRRSFEAPQAWAGQRVLLNFGAVDWEATVSVNGRPVGKHRGGYDPFSFDITDALTTPGPQVLTVSVLDATGGGQAKGKQTAGGLEALGTLGYTAVSGIWQTVWIEPVSPAYIVKLKITPDVDRGLVRVAAITRGTVATDMLEAVVSEGSSEVRRATGTAGSELILAIPRPKLWSPDNPFLYDLKVTLRQRR